jgi:hypothetical protein
MKHIIRSIALAAFVAGLISQATPAQTISGEGSAAAHFRSNNAVQAAQVGKNNGETAQLGHNNNVQPAQLGHSNNVGPARLGGLSPGTTIEGFTLERAASVITTMFQCFPMIPLGQPMLAIKCR